MSITTVVDDNTDSSALPGAERRSYKGFVLGLTISAVIWTLLGIGSMVSVTTSVVPQLPEIAIAR